MGQQSTAVAGSLERYCIFRGEQAAGLQNVSHELSGILSATVLAIIM